MDAPCFNSQVWNAWFHYEDGSQYGVWVLGVQFDYSGGFPVEVNGVIDPADRDNFNCFVFANPQALVIYNTQFYVPGVPYQLAALAKALYDAGVTQLGPSGSNPPGVGPNDIADDYSITCGDVNPNPTGASASGEGNCYAAPGLNVGCPPGYYYDPTSETCLPICGTNPSFCAPLVPPTPGASCNLTCQPPQYLDQNQCKCIDPPMPSRRRLPHASL